MKAWSMAWVCAGALALAVPSFADNEWGVFGSIWAPADGDTSLGGGAKVGIEMVDRVQFDLRYSVMGDVVDQDGASLDVEPLEFGLTFDLMDDAAWRPYLGVGLGYYFMDGEVEGFDAGVDDEVAFFASAGVEFRLSRSGAQYGETTTKLFLEAMYRTVEANDMKISGSPARLEDADLAGLSVQFGLLIGW